MIREIGGVAIQTTHRASCHCGRVWLELDLPRGIVRPGHCNCSICRRKGTLTGSVPLVGLRVIRDDDALKRYRFNNGAEEHYFCAHCGIHTHHHTACDPEHYSFNIGCLDGIDPFMLEADIEPNAGAGLCRGAG
ncbi:GFA family protein [Kushneria aurantia]|uniref:GFA family protein n=1 Tax=Kushneria aurantia TaxID=504092 RepID=A0ABV6G192_9GAMM|nr:GFA family protein [Kushneria aurantia]